MTGLEKLPSILEMCAKELAKVCDDAGGCDHEVGVCCCDLYALIDECDKARQLLAEEKAGDEGLREFIVRIVERAKYLGHSRVDLPVRILEKSLEMYPSRPVSEQKADRTAELVERLREWAKDVDFYDQDDAAILVEILSDYDKGAR